MMQEKTDSLPRWQIVIGAIVTITAALIGLYGITYQTDRPIRATETAEARFTRIAAAPIETPDASATHTVTPSALAPTAAATASLAAPTNPAATVPQTGTSFPEVMSETRDIDGMVMLYVSGNTFQMGIDPTHKDASIDELPQHSVTLSSYWIDRTEVANWQYSRCVASGPCVESFFANDESAGYNESLQPVVGISWYDAKNYCNWVGARLPTEGQWEYAARGPNEVLYPWGNAFDGKLLNFCDRNCNQEDRDLRYDDGYALTAPVGSYPSGASWIGALDMSGNVWEWVHDRFGQYQRSNQVDPEGPSDGKYRVIRGGAWDSTSTFTRATFRLRHTSTTQSGEIGFRCARPAAE